MDKQSTLYQLMGMRMNSITDQDEDYRALLRAVDEYSGKLEALPSDISQGLSRTSRRPDNKGAVG